MILKKSSTRSKRKLYRQCQYQNIPYDPGHLVLSFLRKYFQKHCKMKAKGMCFKNTWIFNCDSSNNKPLSSFSILNVQFY